MKETTTDFKEIMVQKANQKIKETNLQQELKEKNLQDVYKLFRKDDYSLVYHGKLTFSDKSECNSFLNIYPTWASIIFDIKKLNDNYKESEILSLLNQFNSETSFTKFYINDPEEDDEIYISAEICYPIRDSFDAEIYVDTLIKEFESIHNKYQPKIRKLLKNNINNTL